MQKRRNDECVRVRRTRVKRQDTPAPPSLEPIVRTKNRSRRTEWVHRTDAKAIGCLNDQCLSPAFIAKKPHRGCELCDGMLLAHQTQVVRHNIVRSQESIAVVSSARMASKALAKACSASSARLLRGLELPVGKNSSKWAGGKDAARALCWAGGGLCTLSGRPGMDGMDFSLGICTLDGAESNKAGESTSVAASCGSFACASVHWPSLDRRRLASAARTAILADCGNPKMESSHSIGSESPGSLSTR
mmetsp:Transcript_7586/g.46664  ORF Transcript_7586/g.46664 Transcript_7586/m.46664 type:complete len:247 (-) Transcript_7586:2419-3159(-)